MMETPNVCMQQANSEDLNLTTFKRIHCVSSLCAQRGYINPQSVSHNNCRLLCRLPVTLKVIVANSADPDQTAPLGPHCLPICKM